MAGFFDENYYLKHKADQLAKSGVNDADGKPYTADTLKTALADLGLSPEDHYKAYGSNEKLNPNPYFNEVEYLSAKKALLAETDPSWATKTVDQLRDELKATGLTAAEHYEKYGAFEANSNGVLLNPSNAFDANAYFAAKLVELKSAGVEGADTMTVAQVVEFFKESGMSPVTHYEAHGATEATGTGVALVQTVPSEQRVPNDPARTENVPSNYNPPTVGATSPDAAPAPVVKPADMGAKVPSTVSPTVVPPAKPLPTPADPDYVKPPATLVDTNDKPAIPPSDLTNGNWAQVNPDGSADLIKPDGTPGGSLDSGSIDTSKPIDPSVPPTPPTPEQPDTPGTGGGGGGGGATFEATVATDTVSFSGTATGDITFTKDAQNVATFSRGGVAASTKPDLDTVTKIEMGAGQNLSAAAAQVADLTVKGAGSASITGSDAAQTLIIETSGANSIAGGKGADEITLGKDGANFTGTDVIKVNAGTIALESQTIDLTNVSIANNQTLEIAFNNQTVTYTNSTANSVAGADLVTALKALSLTGATLTGDGATLTVTDATGAGDLTLATLGGTGYTGANVKVAESTKGKAAVAAEATVSTTAEGVAAESAPNTETAKGVEATLANATVVEGTKGIKLDSATISDVVVGSTATENVTVTTGTPGNTPDTFEAQTIDLSSTTLEVGETISITFGTDTITYTNAEANSLTAAALVTEIAKISSAKTTLAVNSTTTSLDLTATGDNRGDLADATVSILTYDSQSIDFSTVTVEAGKKLTVTYNSDVLEYTNSTNADVTGTDLAAAIKALTWTKSTAANSGAVLTLTDKTGGTDLAAATIGGDGFNATATQEVQTINLKDVTLTNGQTFEVTFGSQIITITAGTDGLSGAALAEALAAESITGATATATGTTLTLTDTAGRGDLADATLSGTGYKAPVAATQEKQTIDLTSVSIGDGETFTIKFGEETLTYTNATGSAVTGAGLATALAGLPSQLSSTTVTASSASLILTDTAGRGDLAPAELGGTGYTQATQEVQTINLANASVGGGETLTIQFGGNTLTFTNGTAGNAALAGADLAAAIKVHAESTPLTDTAITASGTTLTLADTAGRGNIADAVLGGTGFTVAAAAIQEVQTVDLSKASLTSGQTLIFNFNGEIFTYTANDALSGSGLATAIQTAANTASLTKMTVTASGTNLTLTDKQGNGDIADAVISGTGFVEAKATVTEATKGSVTASDSLFNAYDVITNFDKAHDKVDLTVTDLVTAGTVSNAGGVSNSDVTFDAKGVATFSGSSVAATAPDKITAVLAAMGADKKVAIFVDGSDSYVVQGDGVAGSQSSDVVVKIAGVADITDLSTIIM